MTQRRTALLMAYIVAALIVRSAPAAAETGDALTRLEPEAWRPVAASVDRLVILADTSDSDPHPHADHTHPAGDQEGWVDMPMHHRADAYGPIGVMGAHIHHAGEWMLSYRYMYMEMAGNRDGTDDVGVGEVLRDFMVAPTRMSMEMHMLGVMYAPTDDLTVMVMVPWLVLEMDHVTRMGRTFTTRSEGVGDLRVLGLHSLWRSEGQQVHLNVGVSLPTGSIDEEDDTPAGSDQQLPYPMQLGSGTVDLLPGITYQGFAERWSWGAQAGGTVRLGRNDRGYSLGNRYSATAWSARAWTPVASTSVRARFESWGDVDGSDDALNATMVPTADPNLRAGERLDLLLGLNLLGSPQMKWLAGHRIAVEVGWPIYQRLDGPQLETDWVAMVGWQKAF